MKENNELIASNLTLAFYTAQIPREPYFGDDKRTKFYSPDDENRVPTVSPKEVYSVYNKFLKMLENKDKDVYK